jgi:hypothetical protein
MKNLKLLIIALFASTIGFTSCESDNLNPADDNSAYADFLFYATTDSSGKGHGPRKNITEIDPTTLPANVKSYISTNYVGASIDRAGTSESGKYVVKITLSDGTSRGILFGTDGVFISENKGKGGKGPKGEKIENSAIPAQITSYITSNYAGSEVVCAFKGSEGNYGVVIEKADNTKVMLAFDAALAFKGEMDVKQKGKGKGKGKGK